MISLPSLLFFGTGATNASNEFFVFFLGGVLNIILAVVVEQREGGDGDGGSFQETHKRTKRALFCVVRIENF